MALETRSTPAAPATIDADYEPIDISAATNADNVKIAGRMPVTGERSLRGLPFLIGERCVLLAAGEDAVTIPIGKAAKHVIFAHTLLESKLREGDWLGRAIATYTFRYADGSEEKVDIRERFEIGIIPCPWGNLAFLAHPDRHNTLMDRHQGRWSDSGRRHTEANYAFPEFYYLYAFENPKPEVVIQSVTVTPKHLRFALAGITLGHLEEYPFHRQAKREVRIVLSQAEDAEKPFAVEVEVDRGVATYPYALPQASSDEYMEDAQKGWGEEQNPQSSPAYVEIAGADSATVTVKNDGETLGQVNWGDLQQAGSADPSPRVHLEVVDSGRNWVHTTVLDADTGKQLPCRIHFRSPHGIPYQPHGHHNHVYGNQGTWHNDIGGDVRMGQISYAYIDGKCQGWLPRGEVIVEAACGYEYEPIRERVQIKPGQRELTVRLQRWTDMNEQRYFSGDTHVHFLGAQGAHLEAQGEGLNVVNLLQSQWGHLFTNTEDFIGRPTVSNDGKTIVYCTQENRQHLLGHLTLLGLKEPVMPWCSDGPGEAELAGNLETTLSHWADACHAQGGTVVIPHIPDPNCEPAVLIATGRADAVEMLRGEFWYHQEYYRYLNCGYKLPLVGGTDKMSSDVPVGIYRTYCHLPADEEFNYDNWLKALRSGNTFHSGGPLIEFSVDGQPIGSELRLSGAGTVEVEAVARSIFPMEVLEIVQQGRVVADSGERSGSRELRLKTQIKVEGNTWLAARCGSRNNQHVPHHDGWRRGIFAHTSPIYIGVGGEYSLFDEQVANYMLTLISGGLTHMRKKALQHPPESITHHHGEADHQAFLERPFQEAISAIHQRMHALGIPH